MRVKLQGTRVTRDSNDFVQAVSHVSCFEDSCFEDSVQVVSVLNPSFGWLPTFQQDIADVVCRKHDLKIIKNNNDTKINKKDCVSQQVAGVLNSERKGFKRMRQNSNGFTYTITRHGLELENRLLSKNGREKKLFYNWMILGSLVRFLHDIVYNP